MNDATLNTILLLTSTAIGAGTAAFWLAFIIWTYNDMRARSRDPLAQIAAAAMVAVLFVFGIIIYVMLRPRETLADAYERSLEEEALLQEIEEKPACSGCGRPTKYEWQICPYCHTRLKKACIQCGYLLEMSWNICPSCATSQVVEESAEAIPSGASSSPRRSPSIASQLHTQPPPARKAKSPYDIDAYEIPPTPNENVEWVDNDY
jgi:RNA polymerase subunit RPABC4/transcription elongation factor Spt4